MNSFAKDYEKEQEIVAAFNAAKASGDEAGMQAARDAHHCLVSEIETKGRAYCRLYREYETAMECGNTYLDLHDVIWDKDVEELIACMKENGIFRFTFSSTWSSAVETAWLFQKAGCTLEGLVEINSQHKAFMSEEYEKAHGYLFGVN